MKRKLFRFSIVSLFVMLFSIMFTACTDNDTEQAMALSGEWRGDFGMYYNYEDRGRVYTFNSYDTRIVFYPEYDYATYGWGKQVDYYEYGPYEYTYYEFRWNIRYGIIYLTYPYDRSLDTQISDYRMTNDYLRGYFPGGTQFRLYKMMDYYDWGWSYDDWGYDYRPGWGDYYPYYAPQKEDSDLSSGKQERNTAQTEGRVLSRGNRYVLE